MKYLIPTFKVSAIFLFLALQASAARVDVSPAPSWLVPVTPSGPKPSPREYSDGYYISFIDKQFHLENKVTYTRIIREIVTESGVQNGSEVNVAFDPSYERLSFHYIKVWRDGKESSRLKPADMKVMPVETDRQRFIYNGNYSASLVLPDIRKGDRIEFAYSKTGWNPVFKDKYSGMLNFSTYDYLGHLHYTMIAGEGRPLQFKDFNKPPKKSIQSKGALRIYEWERKAIKKTVYDDNVPGWLENDQFVQVTEFRNWAEVIAWGVQFYQASISSPAVANKVRELKQQAQSQAHYIELATRFVQDEIRYVGVENGENSHNPHRPEQVLGQRYGDCKDKALLLCTLLRAEGFACRPVLVDSYRRGHIKDYLPSPLVFNHVVVAVTLEKKDIYIDGTYSLQGGKVNTIYMPVFETGMPILSGAVGLVDIPVRNTGSVEIAEEFYLPSRFDTLNHGNLLVKSVYFEGEADHMRGTIQNSNLSETVESYLKYYRETYPKIGVEIKDSLEYIDQREANNISLLESYKLSDMWQYDSTRHSYYFSLWGKMVYDQLYGLPKEKRHDPLSLNYPYHLKYKILLRSGIELTVSKEHWEVVRPAYKMRFDIVFNEVEKGWELQYEYRTRQDHVPVTDLEQYRADVTKMNGFLEYEFKNNEGNPAGNPNWWLVYLRVLVIALGGIAVVKLYRYSPGASVGAGEKIAGAPLIMIAIVLCYQPLLLMVSTFVDASSSRYSIETWQALAGASAAHWAGRAILIIHAILHGWLVSFSVFVIVLFFKKRDSFAVMLVWFCSLKLIGIFLEVALNKLDVLRTEMGGWEGIIFIFWLMFASFASRYALKSERSRNTFVNKYVGKEAELISDPVAYEARD